MRKSVYGFILGMVHAGSLAALLGGLTRGINGLVYIGFFGFLAGLVMDKKGREHYGPSGDTEN